jgi:type IV pilus assembly protein PilP
MRHRLCTVGMCALGVVILAGCVEGDHDDIQQWVAHSKVQTKPRITPLQEPKIFMPQAYEVAQGVEPFNKNKLLQVLSRDSENSEKNMALLMTEQNRKKEDLEDYALDTMAFVGSLSQNGSDTGLLRVNQLIYQVKPGAYIGQNYGRILEINENNIQLREVVQDPTGDWVERMTTLNLQEGGK